MRRYLKTFAHVTLWHLTDVTDHVTPSLGNKSVAVIRKAHTRVARAMDRKIQIHNNDVRDSLFISCPKLRPHISHHHRRTGQGAGRGGSRLGFGKLVKFGQMGWEIRAFRGLNFSR